LRRGRICEISLLNCLFAVGAVSSCFPSRDASHKGRGYEVDQVEGVQEDAGVMPPPHPRAVLAGNDPEPVDFVDPQAAGGRR
jgi:hypothetical protein